MYCVKLFNSKCIVTLKLGYDNNKTMILFETCIEKSISDSN